MGDVVGWSGHGDLPYQNDSASRRVRKAESLLISATVAVPSVGATLTCHQLPLLSTFADCSPEAQPKYIKGNKRYGRRSLPEFQQSVEDFAEVTVLEPLGEEVQPPHISTSGREEVSRVAVGTVMCATHILASNSVRAVSHAVWLG